MLRPMSYALSNQTSRVEVAPGPIVTAAFAFRRRLSGTAVGLAARVARAVAEGLGSWAVRVFPRGTFCPPMFLFMPECSLGEGLHK
jgi:hypothetical protein